MKPLTYNSPERAKERQSVVPLSDEEIIELVEEVNELTSHQLYARRSNIRNLTQRLIDHYENLKHFYANSGGWQGLNNLQVNYEIVKNPVT